MNQYIRFEDRPVEESRKTKIVDVVSISHGVPLGQIRWFGQWRQYALFPAPGTIWNPDCLDAVNQEIRKLMAARRAERVPARSYDQEAGGYGSPRR